MTTPSTNSSQGKLEKAMQALLVARKLQRDKFSLGADYVNIEIDVVNTGFESTNEQAGTLSQEYDELVQTTLTEQPQQNSVAEMARWVENNPDAEAVRTQYLVLVESEGTTEQKQQAIEQTSNWLLSHPQAVTVREKYLILINKAGTEQQQQEALAQTWVWLQARQDTYVREQYLVLLGKVGTRQQHQQGILETNAWLELHSEDRYVRAQYLKLVSSVGTRQQQQQAIAQTTMWLRAHPQDNYVREQYLTLVNQLGNANSLESAPRGINLRKLQEVFEAIGEVIDNLSSPPEASLAFRSASAGTWKQIYSQELLLEGQAVLLQLESRAEEEGKISIRIQLQPTNNDLFLPEGLRLFLLSPSQDQLYEDQAESNRELIEVILPDGEPGESFTVEVTKDNTSFIEDFIV